VRKHALDCPVFEFPTIKYYSVVLQKINILEIVIRMTFDV